VAWLAAISIDEDINWMFIGDINFYMSLEGRNRDEGKAQDNIVFNETS
jgi:hypothetical protein